MNNRNDGISWTHDTFNPWEGCDKVSAACAHCYIGRILRQHHREPWGQLYRTGKAVWNKPRRWEKELAGTDQHLRMFTCSLSDFFHVKADGWRPEAWQTIKNTPHCVYLVLTKRPKRIAKHLPLDWGTEGYPNVWLGTSIGDNKSLYQADVLRKVPAAVRFLSCEPLIEDIAENLSLDGIGWVIAGGESGSGKEYLYDPTKRWQDAPDDGRRTMKLDWAYRLYMKANDAGIPFFFKQITSARSGVGADKLTGKLIQEFPAPPNNGVWWTAPKVKRNPTESVGDPAQDGLEVAH